MDFYEQQKKKQRLSNVGLGKRIKVDVTWAYFGHGTVKNGVLSFVLFNDTWSQKGHYKTIKISPLIQDWINENLLGRLAVPKQEDIC